MDKQYKEQAKHLYDVLLRIQKWFKGEGLHETVIVEGDDDCPYDFMWYFIGGLQYKRDGKWVKVLNLHHIEPMIFCIGRIELLLETARERRDAIADLAAMASEQGEDFLQRLSGFHESDKTETHEV
jgi:hypothetical protein|tara:strand:- start:6839 stop:7216 length:378 start_codon:yes stop_codon:yes gene_type:complete